MRSKEYISEISKWFIAMAGLRPRRIYFPKMCWCKKYTYLVLQCHCIKSSAVLWNWNCPYLDYLLIQALDYSSLLFHHTPPIKTNYMWFNNCPNFSSCFQGCYLLQVNSAISHNSA
jgi:hypothetical protein